VTEIKLNTYARVAGLAYIIVILLGIFSMNFIESNIIVPNNISATYSNILGNETLFRISLLSETIMYLLVILLSLSLFVVLKTEDKNLALLALLWRVAEAIIGAGIVVISGLIPLALIKTETLFPNERAHLLLKLFLDIRISGLDIVLMFVGVGGTIFCYLFYKSNYVPRFLAGWGIFTYLSMLLLSIIGLLSADLPETYKLIFYVPGGLFELIFGFWLLFKGVNIKYVEENFITKTN
jgi:hypothetical protein